MDSVSIHMEIVLIEGWNPVITHIASLTWRDAIDVSIIIQTYGIAAAAVIDFLTRPGRGLVRRSQANSRSDACSADRSGACGNLGIAGSRIAGAGVVDCSIAGRTIAACTIAAGSDVSS